MCEGRLWGEEGVGGGTVCIYIYSGLLCWIWLILFRNIDRRRDLGWVCIIWLLLWSSVSGSLRDASVSGSSTGVACAVPFKPAKGTTHA